VIRPCYRAAWISITAENRARLKNVVRESE
jgi:hypothetical protein